MRRCTMTKIGTIGLFVASFMAGCAIDRGALVPAFDSASIDGTTSKADELNRRAADLIDADPAKARRLLEAALSEDAFHGPAHNNMGILHLKRDQLFEAATSFELASKYMPDHPDPHLNLGLVLERSRRYEGACDAYRLGLESSPSHMELKQALVRCQHRRDGVAGAIDATLLREVAAGGTTPEWRHWAGSLLAASDSRPAIGE